MQDKEAKPKKHTMLLVVGIIAITAAMIGGYLLEPPAAAQPPEPTDVPEQYQMVLDPARLAGTEPPATEAPPASVRPQSTARPSPAGILAAGSPSAWRTSALGRESARTTSSGLAANSAAPQRTPSPQPTRTATPRPQATASPAPTPTETEPLAAASDTPTHASQAASSVSTSEPSGEGTETAMPQPTGSGEETDRDALEFGSALAREAASARQREPRAAKTAPAEVTPLAVAAPSPTVSLGGGLLPGADSAFTITREGVEAAGGMKLIEGFHADGTAVLRDIRNTLMTSSSLVKAYQDGEEIGGFEPIGTGTVIELSDRAGEIVDTAVVLIPFDVTGSGRLDIAQLARLAAALDGSQPLSGAYFMAGDYDNSGTLDEGDLMALSYALGRRMERQAEAEARS